MRTFLDRWQTGQQTISPRLCQLCGNGFALACRRCLSVKKGPPGRELTQVTCFLQGTFLILFVDLTSECFTVTIICFAKLEAWSKDCEVGTSLAWGPAIQPFASFTNETHDSGELRPIADMMHEFLHTIWEQRDGTSKNGVANGNRPKPFCRLVLAMVGQSWTNVWIFPRENWNTSWAHICHYICFVLCEDSQDEYRYSTLSQKEPKPVQEEMFFAGRKF